MNKLGRFATPLTHHWLQQEGEERQNCYAPHMSTGPQLVNYY